MRDSSKIGLQALIAVAAISGLAGVQSLPRRRSSPYRPNPPKQDTALAQQIAAHNKAVDAKNAAKRERRALKKALAK